MSDSELILRITGDASGVQEAADQAKEQIERAAQSVSMLGDLIGVKVPEGVQRLIASSALLGPALEAAFPIVAAISLVDVLVQIGEKLADLDSKTEEDRQAWARLHNETQDATTKILVAIDQQKQKYIELTQGPIAALEFELGHMRSIALQSFADISAQMTKVAAQMKADGGFFTAGGRANKQAAEDVKKTLADMDQALHAAALNDPRNLLAPFEAELKVVNDAIDRTKKKVESLPTTEIKSDRFTGSETVEVNQEEIATLKEQRNLYTQIANQIGQQETLQKETLKVEQTRVTVARSDQAQKAADAKSKAKAEAAKAIQQLNDKELADSEKNDIEALKSFKDSNEQIIAAANERFEVEDKRIQGEIDASKVAEQTKEQLIQQSFLKGNITRQQEIRELAQAKVQELQQEITYLRAKEQLWSNDAKKIQEIENQITKLIQQQALVRAKAQNDSLKGVESQYKTLFTSMTNSFKTFADSITTGNQSIAQDFQNLYVGLLKSTINWLEQMLAKKIEMYATEKLMTKQKAAGDVSASAGEAYAAAFASVMASLPFPFNVATAPGVAAAAGSATEAGGLALTAAEYALGGIVPATGLALVHQGEKILPRSMSGNGTGLGGPAVHVHVNLNAMDAESFRGTVSRHGNIIGNEVAKVLRRKGFYSG